MIDTMSGLWINTDAGGLLTADRIMQVYVERGELLVGTEARFGLGSRDSWELSADEYTICRAEALHAEDDDTRNHLDRRLVALIAQARARHRRHPRCARRQAGHHAIRAVTR